MSTSAQDAFTLSFEKRLIILAVAFLGWLCAGVQLQITSLAMNSAAKDLLNATGGIELSRYEELSKAETAAKKAGKTLPSNDAYQLTAWKSLTQRWFTFLVCAFLFGAAAGGYLFGRLGDTIGRSKAMAAAILCYSIVSGATWFVRSPEQLLICRFLTCMGVGGMWPNGVAIVSEAWSKLSRPVIAGIIGTAANIGIFLMATMGRYVDVTPYQWRWVMLVGAIPVVLGLLGLFVVPESPRWLASRKKDSDEKPGGPLATDSSGAPANLDAVAENAITTEPLASSTASAEEGISETPTSPTGVNAVTGQDEPVNVIKKESRFYQILILGIILATIPLMGGWGVANWMMPWADEMGARADPPNPGLKAAVAQCRSFFGSIASLLGGLIASTIGRRLSYFLSCLLALFCAQYAFWFLKPTDPTFLYWVSGLGFFSGFFFGWLPLFLPELFPTRVRSTGAGVSFNFGRIVTALAILTAGLLSNVFQGDYTVLGRVYSLVYAVGMVAVLFAPDTSQSQLDD